jgi:hypothetical protein
MTHHLEAVLFCPVIWWGTATNVANYTATILGHTVLFNIALYHKESLVYSGRKITEILGNVTVRGEKDGKSKMGTRLSTVCLSMYSITENIYYSQLSSVAILLQPEPTCFTSYNTRKWWCFSPSLLSSFGLPLPPTCLILTVSEARSYFASTIT